MSKTNKVLNKIKENKTLQHLIIGAISVIIIVILAVIFNGSNKTKTTSYVDTLEAKLEETLSKIDGAGKVSVIITVENETAKAVAYTTTTEKTSNGTKTTKTPLVVNGEVVYLGDAYPTITGVLIVAEGAKNLSVLTKLQYATTTLLNVDVSKVEILPSK